MGRLRWQVAAAAAMGLALALEALPGVLRWLRSRRRRPRREVLFFPSQVTCTEALLRAPGAALAELPEGCPCGLPHGESALSRLLRALLAARASLELCLFAFSSPQLGRAVQLLHQRGVRVRVVTDCDYMALNGSQIGLLRKAGRPGGGPGGEGRPEPRGVLGKGGHLGEGVWERAKASFTFLVALWSRGGVTRRKQSPHERSSRLRWHKRAGPSVPPRWGQFSK